MALTPSNCRAIKKQTNQPRNRAEMEDDILVFQIQARRAVNTEGEDWRGVILFLKVTTAWAWEQCTPGLQDLLCETQERVLWPPIRAVTQPAAPTHLVPPSRLPWREHLPPQQPLSPITPSRTGTHGVHAARLLKQGASSMVQKQPHIS